MNKIKNKLIKKLNARGVWFYLLFFKNTQPARSIHGGTKTGVDVCKQLLSVSVCQFKELIDR